MCGIVGILGREPVAGALVDALKRLEYRGYDSAGIATLEKGQLARRRAEGKLRNLEAKLAREPLAGTIGIGHTRWATHGKPTESNAHPHATDRLAVVIHSRPPETANTVGVTWGPRLVSTARWQNEPRDMSRARSGGRRKLTVCVRPGPGSPEMPA